MLGFLKPGTTRTPQEIKALLDAGQAVLVDVREQSEHAEMAIPGARLVPLSRFSTRDLPELGDRELVLHCKGGARSADALTRCRDAGITRVSHMAGGIMAWHGAGLPVR